MGAVGEADAGEGIERALAPRLAVEPGIDPVSYTHLDVYKRQAPLREAHETLLSRAERARYLALGAERRWSNSVDEHAGILAALEARDGETAGRLLSAHVLRTGTALLEVLARTTLKRPAA